jgi:hypothetical protein
MFVLLSFYIHVEDFQTPKETKFMEYGYGLNHVKWVPCHHGMARPQVADGGEGLQIWRVAANILNK